MLSILTNRTYRHLLTAQIIALVGTGLATVALGLLAFEIAGGNAGAVLGTALAIKMLAYIGVAPVVGAFADKLPRRAFLVAMDLIRCGVALVLPFVTEIWQVYVLIFVLQSASAAFTPTFQATIPDVLPKEADYTRALSLSRLAYDLESLLSPMLAAVLLSVVSFHWLFAGTAVGFIGSAFMVLSVALPHSPAKTRTSGIYAHTTRGMRFYLKTPRLRGLLAVNLAAAAASAMVIVNTVVIVRQVLGLGQGQVAWALAAYGGGSMIAALALPRVLDRVRDRTVMLSASFLLAFLLAAGAASFEWIADEGPLWAMLLSLWSLMGLAYSASITPSGRLLRRSSGESDRPAIFAAQFALSHVCWLIAYPLAGQVGAKFGQSTVFLVLSGLAFLGVLAAFASWPSGDADEVAHSHDDLEPDHPHLATHGNGVGHKHAYFIDDLHQRWPV